jgi:drug/metabolite transporter (DMT)-like permease
LLSIGLGFVIVLGNVLSYVSIHLNGVAITSVVNNIQIIQVILIGYIIFKEKFTKYQCLQIIFGITLIFIGLILIFMLKTIILI